MPFMSFMSQKKNVCVCVYSIHEVVFIVTSQGSE